jgi:hypothetical protein
MRKINLGASRRRLPGTRPPITIAFSAGQKATQGARLEEKW